LVSHVKVRAQIESVFKQGMRRIFGPRKDNMREGWKKLHNEKLNNFYSLLNIVRIIESRR
jgi:hypothetical protein